MIIFDNDGMVTISGNYWTKWRRRNLEPMYTGCSRAFLSLQLYTIRGFRGFKSPRPVTPIASTIAWVLKPLVYS